MNTPPLRLVPYQPPPNPLTEQDRKLNGPRYDLSVAKQWADQSRIFLVTEDCRRDVAALRWTYPEVAELLNALTPDHYWGSEWCATGKGMVIDCDAYALKFDTHLLELSQNGIDLYVKFGFRFPAANYILIISCHPSTRLL